MDKICNNCISAIYRYLYFYLMELRGGNSVDQFSRSSAFWIEISFSDNAGAMKEKYPLSRLKY
jgi:hypothetical protein